MRHRLKGKKLSRDSAQRKALLRNLVTSFLEKERIRTTLAKAKATRPIAEKMITLGKKNSLQSRRLALRMEPKWLSSS
jgi:large subunit ribosomal protein L17